VGEKVFVKKERLKKKRPTIGTFNTCSPIEMQTTGSTKSLRRSWRLNGEIYIRPTGELNCLPFHAIAHLA
jgi:hypothetical protein